MGADSKIQWTHHTFNPWIGCQKVSAGCENCYASVNTFVRVQRSKGRELWGPPSKSERHFFADGHWKEPLSWNKKAEAAGERRRVFCASMADVFEDRPELVESRRRLFDLVVATPWLDWLLLTKRPENMRRLAAGSGWPGAWPWNVWAGCTVEHQSTAEERVPWILEVPATIRFLSCEPLLGPLDLTRVIPKYVKDALAQMPPERRKYAPHVSIDCLKGHVAGPDDVLDEKIDWIIVGGESGGSARHLDLDWARSLIGQCRESGTRVFVKQLGAVPVTDVTPTANFRTHKGKRQVELKVTRLRLADRAGGDPVEWPEDLRIREFPEVGP